MKFKFSYKQLKVLILIIPTITIGLWEQLRHSFLLPYITMETGNLLAPFIVLAVTVTIGRLLFDLLEDVQDQLQEERMSKAALEEREKIARELHDGIAQSLFLLSVKLDQPSKSGLDTDRDQELRKTVHQVNEYVRQAISGLRYPAKAETMPWEASVKQLFAEIEENCAVQIHKQWELSEENLNAKEKVELYAFLRESLLNVRKHARATNIWVSCVPLNRGWVCKVEDDGMGFDVASAGNEGRYGLKIMKERAAEMGWNLVISRESNRTKLQLSKGVDNK